MGKHLGRTLQKLSDVVVKSSKLKSGRHSDGGGLYLNVTPAGSKSWLFMWAREGKRREMGLGPYPDVGLSKARVRANECRQLVADGRDPIEERDREEAPTFGDAADDFIKTMKSEFRNAKHIAQWEMTLKVYAKPIRAKTVDKITTEDVLKVLKPLWLEKPETASRLRGRIERVLDASKAQGHRAGENPARWRGHLDSLLPKRQKLSRGHHAALAYSDVPAFMVALRAWLGTSARALEFLILTASRSGEVLLAKWEEVDMEAKIWTVPAERMKAGREHRVPLSATSFDLITRMHNQRVNDFIFPGMKKDRPLSVMSMAMLMRRMEYSAFTVHGFRSAFRDWAGDSTTFPREVAEAALAHTVGDETERAYRRSDALAKRRKLMDAWERYLGAAVEKSNILPMKKGVA
jgi:integrase